jgi:hypothetical protein
VAVVIVATIMVLLGQIFDLVDQRSRTMSEIVFVTLVHRLVIERSAVEGSLDLARQCITLVRDIGDLFQIFCVSFIVGRNGSVGVYEALSAQFAERCIKLLVVLRQLDEVLLTLLDALRLGARFKPLGQNAPVVDIAVLQAQQRHHRGTNVSVIGEHGVVAAEVPNAGPDYR